MIKAINQPYVESLINLINQSTTKKCKCVESIQSTNLSGGNDAAKLVDMGYWKWVQFIQPANQSSGNVFNLYNQQNDY